MTDYPLAAVVADFTRAFKAVDFSRPEGRSKTRVYKPGIGLLSEAEAVSKALAILGGEPAYSRAASRMYPGGRQQCDLVIPSQWAIEFKLLRPFGDNGQEAEHWSENILHPYPGNTSSIGDCLKLASSSFSERKAIIVFGYEHSPPIIDLTPVVKGFELLAEEIARIELGSRYEAVFGDLIHPYHQVGRVFGWEVIGVKGQS